jgi:hypothetical protein
MVLVVIVFSTLQNRLTNSTANAAPLGRMRLMAAAQAGNPDRYDVDGTIDLGPDQTNVLKLTIAHTVKLSRRVLLDAPPAVRAPTALRRGHEAV